MGDHEPIYIGAVVERLRRSKLISQQQLAEISSLSEKSIQQIEKDRQEPRLSTLYALATAFDLEFVEFMKQIDHHFKNHG